MNSKLKLNMLRYRNEHDFWRIRNFLREVMMLNDLREFSWHVARFDYWRWHGLMNCREIDSPEGFIFIWETSDEKIAAVLNPENEGDAFLQVHPSYRSTKLETEMIVMAEQELAVKRDRRQYIAVWVNPEDTLRTDILKQRGYTRGKWTEFQWRRDLMNPISKIPVPDGYVIRSLGDKEEIPKRSWASWRGFHPNEPDEDYDGWEWYHKIQQCPLYRRDLDIVAVTSTAEIVSFCTLWYDDFTRSAYIEPVATVPNHLRRGLARSTISEGLDRVQKIGALRAFVGGYEPGPNALYSSTLSLDHDKSEQWIRKW